ncbi:hypothetical protein E2542_SST05371 [Spatholobus suberectus]|nr:hypothetical protein E2542_SST05371 [Spatholobus suberectus]
MEARQRISRVKSLYCNAHGHTKAKANKRVTRARDKAKWLGVFRDGACKAKMLGLRMAKEKESVKKRLLLPLE